MNPAAAIVRFFRLAPRGVGGAVRPQGAAPIRSRRAARRAVGCFLAAVVAVQAFAVLALDTLWPRLRDPEYGRRAHHLRARLAEHPGRPLVLVVGSSRTAMGVRPDAWEDARPDPPGRPDPLLFNMSLVGSGPVMELMCLRRVYAEGFRPDAVVLEVWPPFLREDGSYWEPSRIDPNRLTPADRPFVHDYFRGNGWVPEKTDRQMLANRLNPVFKNRHQLLAQLDARWQPWHARADLAWSELDRWGWLGGVDEDYPPDPTRRAAMIANCRPVYQRQFTEYAVAPLAGRAYREAVALARAHGTKVAFAYLPEATEFRAMIPPAVEQEARRFIADLGRELAVPLIDARLWMEDGYLVDGFHLSRLGAARFTQRFGPAVAATFPDLGGGR